MDKHYYEYWFLDNTDISYAKKTRLCRYFENSFNIFYASEKELLESGLLEKSQVQQFLKNREKVNLDKLYETFTRTPYSFMTIESDNYPKRLNNIFDPPYGIFYKGTFPKLEKTVAIVGARRCSAYGKRMAQELSNALAMQGYTVISGMARGIDSYAHTGCLQAQGQTVAVLGCGVDIVYPPENNKLYNEITESGAVISEFPIGFAPIPANFPQRNRIVSGLADKVIVVEARAKSGSLITADFALEQGKDIYVCPGRIGDALSEGCNCLINQGASIITSIDRFLSEIGEENIEPAVRVTKKGSTLKLTEEQLLVLGCFDDYPKSLSQAQAECKMDYLKIISVVMSLVRVGLLSEAFKNHYVICG